MDNIFLLVVVERILAYTVVLAVTTNRVVKVNSVARIGVVALDALAVLVVRYHIRGTLSWVRSVFRASSRVLGQIINKIGPADGSCKSRGPCCELGHLIVSQVLKEWMPQQLRCCISLVCIVNQHLKDDLLSFFRHIRY